MPLISKIRSRGITYWGVEEGQDILGKSRTAQDLSGGQISINAKYGLTLVGGLGAISGNVGRPLCSGSIPESTVNKTYVPRRLECPSQRSSRTLAQVLRLTAGLPLLLRTTRHLMVKQALLSY